MEFGKGELVFVFTPLKKVGRAKKLLAHFVGPFEVIARVSDLTYSVRHVETGRIVSAHVDEKDDSTSTLGC